ncbi:MAG: family 16 glycoside hydrolase, partial [Limisphaerales bacterium]
MKHLITLTVLLFAPFTALHAAPVSLFDGKTLAGWEGNSKLWRVQDGMITGGSLDERVPRNEFIATVKSFHNFDLRLKIRLSGTEGFINSGVQIRSVRVPNNSEMSGYQVDYGKGWYGKLYDESRRNKVVADSTDPKAAAAIKAGEWNEYRIVTEGPRIRSWINGVAALDYTETEPGIAQDGLIGIQVHGGGKALVQAKDITIEELPPTPDAPTWEKLGGYKAPPPKAKGADKKAEGAPGGKTAGTGRDISYNAITSTAQSPGDQLASFKLPAGFEIELVAAESEGIGKFIAVDWDASGRMWSMTALEYPVDGNENKAASDALFARGGRDRVIVFDVLRGGAGQPPAGGSPAPLRYAAPRVFADNLVMPLGVLPYKDGAFVQYGSDIRFYRDTNGDGRADKSEVILTGFGTQDSHLFPHQFTRVPGGWIFVAQGLFNYSTVRRPNGQPFADGTGEIPFNQCKLARFTPDGSRFENLTAGPNNIWGLTISREGETWIQEANDIGRPLVPYEPGTLVVTGSKDRLRPYQPLQPATLAPPQMGGTGLSGLALADDSNTPFRNKFATEAGAKIFFLANPITSVINVVKATPDGPRYRYEKIADLLTTSDRWFRPVAIAFGPDGCLYITDWYNKIISHNEVPRTHPDRDKTRGRIWRVRHKDQARTTPPDLTKLGDKELLAQLASPNSRIARLAWLEIIDRKATGLAPELEKRVADKSAPADQRLAWLWALEGLRPVPTALIQSLAADPNPNLRHEAARLTAAQSRSQSEFLALATKLVDDPHPRVRAAIGDALRHVPDAGPGAMALAAQLGREPL